jgi:PAS domain S-box-containing protein
MMSESLERSHTLLTHMEQLTEVGGWELVVETDELVWTDGARRIHGVDDAYEPTLSEAIEFYHPEDRDTIREAFDACRTDGVPYHLELRLVTADGRTRWVETTGERIEQGGRRLLRGAIKDITDQKQAREQLQQSRDWYSRIFETSNDAILIIDPEQDEIIDANTRAEELLGYEYDTLLEKIRPTDLHEHEIEKLHGFLDDIFDEGTGWTDELSCKRADGSYVPTEMSASVIEIGGRTCLLASIRDISERKEREQELRRFKRAVEATGHAVFITDTDGIIEYVNPAFETITGYDSEQAVGETPTILQSGEMSDDYFQQLWETITAGERWEEEIVNRRADGDRYHAHQTIAPISDTDGGIRAFVAIQTDITERKEREAKLKRTQRAIDEAPVGVCITDPNRDDNPLMYVNDEFVEMTGYARADAIGRNCRFLQGDQTDPSRIDRIREAIDAREPISTEVRNYRKDGTEFLNHLEIAPVTDETGELLNYVGFQQNVTDRKYRLEQLQILDRVLRHNLRNEMTAIQGNAELIRSETASEELSNRATDIIEGGDRLTATATKIREVIERLIEKPQYRPIDLRSFLQHVAFDLRDRFPEATIEIDCTDEITVSTVSSIKDAIRELLTNAIIHNDVRSPEVFVRVRTDSDGVSITVEDNGPTIPEMERRVLLGEKERTPTYHGSGLGLWLVNVIAARSGGYVQFEANEPHGNMVTIALPHSALDRSARETTRRDST